MLCKINCGDSPCHDNSALNHCRARLLTVFRVIPLLILSSLPPSRLNMPPKKGSAKAAAPKTPKKGKKRALSDDEQDAPKTPAKKQTKGSAVRTPQRANGRAYVVPVDTLSNMMGCDILSGPRTCLTPRCSHASSLC